jgi:hypothetical protein
VGAVAVEGVAEAVGVEEAEAEAEAVVVAVVVVAAAEAAVVAGSRAAPRSGGSAPRLPRPSPRSSTR